MEKRTQEQINQVAPNLQTLKNEIDLYLQTLNCFRNDDPETAEWKFEAARHINSILEWYSSRVKIWTTQILDGVKTREGFPSELVDLLNSLNMTPNPGKDLTTES